MYYNYERIASLTDFGETGVIIIKYWVTNQFTSKTKNKNQISLV